MRSTHLKGLLIILITLFMVGYLFYSEIPTVYGEWTNRGISINPTGTITTFPEVTLTYTVEVHGTSPPNDLIILQSEHIYVPTGKSSIGLGTGISGAYKPAPYTTTMTAIIDSTAQIGLHSIRIRAYSQSNPSEYTYSNVVYINIKPKLTIAPTLIFSTLTTTPGPTALPFDFALILSPPSITLEQGESANYQLQLTYSEPSYSGIPINYQVAGLGSGMTWIPSVGGAISISTSPTTPPGTYTITVIGSAQGQTHQTSAILIVTESTPTTVDEEETTTTLIESTSPTTIEPITVTVTERSTTPTSTVTTELQTDNEGSAFTSQLLNPTVLMVIIIAVLATALITTLMRKRK